MLVRNHNTDILDLQNGLQPRAHDVEVRHVQRRVAGLLAGGDRHGLLLLLLLLFYFISELFECAEAKDLRSSDRWAYPPHASRVYSSPRRASPPASLSLLTAASPQSSLGRPLAPLRR